MEQFRLALKNMERRKCKKAVKYRNELPPHMNGKPAKNKALSPQSSTKRMIGTTTVHIYYAIRDQISIVDAMGKDPVMIAQKTMGKSPPEDKEAVNPVKESQMGRRNALTEDDMRVEFATIRDSILSSTLQMYGLA